MVFKIPSMRDISDEVQRIPQNVMQNPFIFHPYTAPFQKTLNPLAVEPMLSPVTKPNLQGSSDLMDAIAGRRGLIEGSTGVYHQAGPMERYDASQIGFNPNIDMSGALKDRAMGFAGQLGNMQTFRPDLRTSEDLRAKAMGFADRLGNFDVPSTAMLQHRKATDRGLNQAMALAASSRDPRALRDAMNMQGTIQRQASLDSGLIAAQEQAAKAQQLGQAANLLSGLRGQDIGASEALNRMGLQAQQQRAQQLAQAAGISQGLRGQDIDASTNLNRLRMEKALANQRALNEASKTNMLEANRGRLFDTEQRIKQDELVNQRVAKTYDQQLQAQRDLLAAQAAQRQAETQERAAILGAVGQVGSAMPSMFSPIKLG